MAEHIKSPPPTEAMPPRGGFDEEGYLYLHPDIAQGVSSGLIESGWQHFVQHGFTEGRAWVGKADSFRGVQRDIAPHDEMFSGNEEHYFDVGASALQCIEAALFAAQRNPPAIKRILDLPCGHGRVMRFLRKAFPKAELTACDLNRDGVEYCAKTFNAIPFLSREAVAEIPLPTGFDLVWCGSLLTHLPQVKCQAFLELFHRSLRPGGILLFTMHGRLLKQELASGKNPHGITDQQIGELLAQYSRDGFGFVPYAPRSAYGFSLAAPSFVITHFVPEGAWRTIGYHEAGWDKRQDVVALQKRF